MGWLLLLAQFVMLLDTGVTLSCRPERSTITLSDRLQVELEVEGPSPLRVELPASPLAEATAALWESFSDGPPELITLAEGRQLWRQRLVLEPFAVGSPHAIQFQPLKVWLAAEAQPRVYRFEDLKITVTSSVRPTIDELRPPTDWDDPLVRADATRSTVMLLLGLAGGVVLLALVCWRRQRRLVPALTLSPEDQFQQALRELAESPTAELGTSLAAALRRWLAQRINPELLASSTTELVERLQAMPEWQAESQPIRQILERCDAEQFAEQPLSRDERAELVGVAAELLQRVQSRSRVNQP